jgi:hypothetical protein
MSTRRKTKGTQPPQPPAADKAQARRLALALLELHTTGNPAAATVLIRGSSKQTIAAAANLLAAATVHFASLDAIPDAQLADALRAYLNMGT